MFAYQAGNVHVGHVRNDIIGDVVALSMIAIRMFVRSTAFEALAPSVPLGHNRSPHQFSAENTRIESHGNSHIQQGWLCGAEDRRTDYLDLASAAEFAIVARYPRLRSGL